MALIGCISPTVKDIALYRVNVTLVANELHTLANLDSRNKTNVPRSSELPTYWYWGFSGACAAILVLRAMLRFRAHLGPDCLLT